MILSLRSRLECVALLSLTTILASCSGGGTKEILSRVPSPTGLQDAVIVRVNRGGATVGFVDEVFLVPHGAEAPDEKYARFAAQRTDSLRVQWADSDLVDIHYSKAEIFVFRNTWDSRSAPTTIELRLRPSRDRAINVVRPVVTAPPK